MNVNEMTVKMLAFSEECEILAFKKNRDYHPDNVAYLEILRTAHETGVTVEQDLWGRIRKQLSALRSYVIEGRTQSESPRSRMIDVANYMAILAVWDKYKVQITADATAFVAGTPCELLSINDRNRPCLDIPYYQGTECDRCSFLRWLFHQHAASVSQVASLPSTPKPPD